MSLRNPNLTWRLRWWFLATALLPLVSLWSYLYLRADQVLRAGVATHIESLADSKAEQLETFAIEQLKDARILAESPHVFAAVERLVKNGDPSTIPALRSALRALLADSVAAHKYSNVFVIALPGQELFSFTDQGDSRTNHLAGPALETELARVFVRSRRTRIPVMSDFAATANSHSHVAYVAAPVLRDDTLIGVLVVEINHDQIHKVVDQLAGLGETGETIVVRLRDDAITIMLPTRHDPQAAFDRTIPLGDELGQSLQRAASGDAGSGFLLDYRGREVFSAWRYLPSSGWGMAVEIDTREVLAPLDHILTRVARIGLLAVVIVFVLAWYAARSLSRPIIKLTHAAHNIAGGQLEQRVAIEREDEIGELARAFNTMTDDVRRMHATLEEQVRERTAELREQHARFQELTENILEVFWLGEPGSLENAYVSPAYETIWGRTAESLYADPISWLDTVHPDDRERVFDTFTRYSGSVESWEVEFRIVRPDGSARWIRNRGFPILDADGKSRRMAGIAEDFTDRKRADEEYHQFFNQSESLLMIAGFDGFLRKANPAFLRAAGYSIDELLSIPFVELVHPEDREKTLRQLEQSLHHGFAHDFNVRLSGLNGAIRHISVSSTTSHERQCFYVVGEDVTEEKLAKEEKQTSERRYLELVETSPDIIWSLDLEGRFTFVNGPALDAILGYQPEEWLGHPFVEFLPPGEDIQLLPLFQRLLAGETLHQMDGTFLHRDGTPKLMSISGAPNFDEHGSVVSLGGTSRDITENKRAEARLRGNEQRMREQQAALVALTRTGRRGYHADSDELQTITETSARTLGASRVSVWRYNADRSAVHCVDLFEAETGKHSIGGELPASSYPAYFEALANMDILAADDANADPRTREFSESYLKPLGIGAMLDAPIHLAGQVEGVVCHEYIGTTRQWTADEQTFAVAVANLVSLLLQEEERQRILTELSLANNDLRRKEQRFRALVEATTAVDWTTGASGEVETELYGWAALTGQTLEQTLGWGWFDAVHPDDRADTRNTWMAAHAARSVYRMEHRVRRYDGEYRDMRAYGVPIMDEQGNLLEWMGAHSDITEQKQAEVALFDAKAAADAANLAKSEFLANMSHEIRTPMNGVIGLTELALGTELSAEQREYLMGIAISGNALLQVINDILDFSKIEAGKLEIDAIDFNLITAVELAVETMALRAHEKDLELTCDIHPEVPNGLIGDPARLRQVLINLVGNAVKFTAQGEVAVTVEPDRVTSDTVWLTFSVSDTGIGIPAEKQQAIFEAFTQADGSTTRNFGGTGLGLTISSKLVQLMGGQLQLESEQGYGSRFYFTIPFSSVQQQNGKSTAPRRSTELAGLRVLLVDDNATSRQILLRTLARHGIDAAEADSGASALSSLRNALEEQVPFQLILLDVCMPGMDGFTLLEQIRQDPDLDRPAILMLSSIDRGKDIFRARELGAAAFIVKPAQWNKLRAAIGEALAVVGDAPATSEPPVPPDSQAEIPAGSLRILIAEDNAVNRLFARRVLEKAGHEAIIAENGEVAIALLEESRFDVVLMDVQMPIMDGYQATARIREKEQGTNRHQPIIAMTAHAMKGDREYCLERGMDNYVSKPIQSRLLLKAIAEVLAPTSSGKNHLIPEQSASRDIHIFKEDTMPLDPEYLRKLSVMFLEDCPQLMSNIRDAIDGRNAAGLKLASHTLKGPAGVFRDQPAFNAAFHMERIGCDADWSNAESAWTTLSAEMKRLSGTLSALVRPEHSQI